MAGLSMPSRLPAFEFFGGRPFPGCWVALNEATPARLGSGLWAGPCNDDSTFTIPNVPPGSYQLEVFDANLDVVIASQGTSTRTASGIRTKSASAPKARMSQSAGATARSTRTSRPMATDLRHSTRYSRSSTGSLPKSALQTRKLPAPPSW